MTDAPTPAWWPFTPRFDPAYDCARCKRPGSLYDAEFARPEGTVCWVCVDAEKEIPNTQYPEWVIEEMAYLATQQKETAR